jgi:hypothetical protein
VGELSLRHCLKEFTQALAQSTDPSTTSLCKSGPRFLLEECSLPFVSLLQSRMKIVSTTVPHNTITKFQVLVFGEYTIDHKPLHSSLSGKVRFGEKTECSNTFRIRCLGKLQDVLSGDVASTVHDSKDARNHQLGCK